MIKKGIISVRRFAIAGLATVFLLSASLTLTGQPFSVLNQSLTAAGRGSIAWCDYDGDHDLDLFISGQDHAGSGISTLYRNDGGNFNPSGLNITGMKESSSCWGDYDGDGDQDLLLTGNSDAGDRARIFRNDGATFMETDPGIQPVQNGDICWVDVDADGDLDIFITGNWIAKIYYNSDGEFTAGSQSFGYFSSSAASWADFDRDGDPDLLICGDSGAGAICRIFKNEQGQFTDIEAGLPGVMAGTAEWVDYDNDGDVDVAISGFNDGLEAQFHLLKNQGKTFQTVYAGIDGFANGAACWGDYDLDGDADLIMSGKATGCGAYVSGIYRNDGNDVFYKTSYDFTTAHRSALAWADYDNDGDLDFAISGLNVNDVAFTRVYRNDSGDNLFSSNTLPSAPSGLISEVEDQGVTFEWSASVDAQTAGPALSYNLALGSAPGQIDLIAPMSDPASGIRMITRPGNCSQVLSFGIQGLDPGVYYWSVQAIDQAFEGSGFAPWQSFEILATGLSEGPDAETMRIFPNPASDRIFLSIPEETGEFMVTITDISGRAVVREKMKPGLESIEIGHLPAGFYRVMAGNSALTRSAVLIRR